MGRATAKRRICSSRGTSNRRKKKKRQKRKNVLDKRRELLYNNSRNGQFAKNNKQREYPLLKQWFVEKFKEQYKMTDAKKIHAKHVMAKATGKVVKLAAAKPAVNQ